MSPDAVLVERLDKIDSRTQKIDAEVKRMGPVLQTLSKKVASAAKGKDDEEGSQPDWVGCRNPMDAAVLLKQAEGWVESYLVPFGGQAWPPCWPWHPTAVIAALVLGSLTVEAFSSAKPSDVGDIPARWVPVLAGRMVQHAMRECGVSAHADGVGGSWTVDVDRLEEYAAWWATSDRTGVPPGLTYKPE